MAVNSPATRRFWFDTNLLRWQVFGEIAPPALPRQTEAENRALNSIGRILRTHRSLTVAQCDELYRRVENDLSMKQTIILELAEQDARLMELSRQVEAGRYHVEGDAIAERMLTYPEHRDYERRLAYFQKREDLRQEATGMAEALPSEPEPPALARIAWEQWLVEAALTLLLLTGLFGVWMLAQNRATDRELQQITGEKRR